MTLQARLSLIIISTFISFWAITSYFSVSKLENNIELSMDNRLQATAAMMQNILQITSRDNIRLTGNNPVLVNDAATSKGLACRVSSLSGKVVANSHPNVFKEIKIIEPGFSIVEEDNIKWRTFTSKTAEHTITIADKMSERSALYYQIAISTAIPSALGLIISLAFAWVAVRHYLNPLETFSNSLKDRNIKDLSPVVLNSSLKELQPLVDSQNELLSRLKDSIEREKSFTENAAHELRTPLTGIISQLQVAGITDGEVHNNALAQCEVSAQLMSKLIDDLLILSRLESGVGFHIDGEWQLKHEIDSLLNEIGDARNRIDVIIPVNLSIDWMPSFALNVICRNLLDNAIRYGDKGNIQLNVISEVDGLSVLVTNSGTIEEKKLKMLSHRFWRDSVQEGTGLGLAIVEALAKQFDGHIEFEQKTNNIFSVFVRLRKQNKSY